MNDCNKKITEQSKIHVNGEALSYRVYGQGNQDLLFIHGFLARGTLYNKFFSELSRYFKITALDLRAHGDTMKTTKDFTLEQLAEDVIAVTNKLELHQPLYVGHSLGGILGLLSELNFPGTFHALALLAPAPAKAEKVKRSDLVEHRNKAAMRDSIRPLYVRDVSDEDLSTFIEAACLVDPILYEQYLTEEYPKLDISKRLKEIKPPVLFLNGALDTLISPDAIHQTAMGLPHYKEVIFSNEGHMFPLESPERTAREIIYFNEHDL